MEPTPLQSQEERGAHPFAEAGRAWSPSLPVLRDWGGEETQEESGTQDPYHLSDGYVEA